MSGANRILGAVTSSVKFAANSLRLKDPDPEFSKASKYFEGVDIYIALIEMFRILSCPALPLHTYESHNPLYSGNLWVVVVFFPSSNYKL